jgi:serine/threonine protein kinase
MGDVVPLRVGARASTGMRLGKYELVSSLAAGGMAELFVARQAGIEGFEKLVVLKRILPQLADRQDFVRMFLDEARLAATLHHPNIAQVYDIGFEPADRSYFFTMEYVQGRDARDVLRAARDTGGLPLEHALAIVCGVAAGLHYAHERDVVHRDISPSNVLVSFDGGVKLVDFGIAKVRSRHSETQAGSLKGKIAYMSPEQCRGEDVDRRSDVFALGVLLYELTTATRLFRGTNEFALIQDITGKDAPPPSSRRADYPPALEAIVMRALARDREARYATAEDLQLALERFAHDARLAVSELALRRYMHVLFGEGATPVPDAVKPSTIVMEADLPDVDAEVAAPPAHTPVPARRRRWWIAPIAVSIVAAIGGAAIALTSHAKPAAPTEMITIAASEPALPAPKPPLIAAPTPTPAPVVATPAPPPPAPPPPAPKPKHAPKKAAAHWDPDSPFLPGEK